MKKKVIWIIVALVVVAGAILGLTVFRNGKDGKVEYRTEAVSRGDIEALVVTSGTLNPLETVDVGAQVSGKIVELYADFNSQVTKGQVVAELDQEPLKMKIDQNEANYKSRVASLDRSKVNLQTAEKNLERAKSPLRQGPHLDRGDGRRRGELPQRQERPRLRRGQPGPGQEHARPEQGRPRIRRHQGAGRRGRHHPEGQHRPDPPVELPGPGPVPGGHRPDQDEGRVQRRRVRHRQGQGRAEGPVHGRSLPHRELQRHRPAGPLLARDRPERRHVHDDRQRREPREEAPPRHDGDGVHHRRRGQERPPGPQRRPPVHAHPHSRGDGEAADGDAGQADGPATGRRRPAGRRPAGRQGQRRGRSGRGPAARPGRAR